MARTKPKEIIRRTEIPARHAEVPILAVHADQDPSRYAGVGLKVAARGAEVLSGILAQRTARLNTERAEADFNEGYALRQKEDIEGTHRLPVSVLAQATEDYQRGYNQADFPGVLNRWKVEAARKLAQLEPDVDPEPLMQEWTAELLQQGAVLDPKTRNAALAQIQEAVSDMRVAHQKNVASELLTRQQEALTSNIRNHFKSGQPLTADVITGFRALTNTPEFGYLHEREADALFVEALTESMANGEVDLATTLKFLETFKDENGVSFMDGAHGAQLRAAAASGLAVQEKRADEQRAQMQADAFWELTDKANRGQLTRDELNRYADAFGLEGPSRTAFLHRWNTANEQTRDKWRRESAERARQQELITLIQQNPYAVSDEGIRHFLDAQFAQIPRDPQTPEEHQQQKNFLQYAASLGVVPSEIQNRLRRVNPTNPESFARAHVLFEVMTEIDPSFAIKAAGDTQAARFAQYQADTQAGIPQAEALSRLDAPKLAREEAEHVISRAWSDWVKNNPTAKVKDETVELTEWDRYWLRREGAQIAMDTPGISPDVAMQTALQKWAANQTKVNGYRVSNQGMPPGGEVAAETLLASVAHRLNLPLGDLTAQPLRGSRNQWVVVNTKDGFPVLDPDADTETGQRSRVIFTPGEIAAHYTNWDNQRREVIGRSELRQARGKRLFAQEFAEMTNYATVQGIHPGVLERLQSIRDELRELEATPDPIADAIDRKQRQSQLSAERRAAAQRGDFTEAFRLDGEIKALIAHGTTAGIPDDFLDYINSIKGP